MLGSDHSLVFELVANLWVKLFFVFAISSNCTFLFTQFIAKVPLPCVPVDSIAVAIVQF